MLGPHDPIAWALTWAGVSAWGAAFMAMLATETVTTTLFAASLACLVGFIGFAGRLASLLLRLVEAWVDYKVSRFMTDHGFDDDTIDEVIDGEQ